MHKLHRCSRNNDIIGFHVMRCIYIYMYVCVCIYIYIYTCVIDACVQSIRKPNSLNINLFLCHYLKANGINMLKWATAASADLTAVFVFPTDPDESPTGPILDQFGIGPEVSGKIDPLGG